MESSAQSLQYGIPSLLSFVLPSGNDMEDSWTLPKIKAILKEPTQATESIPKDLPGLRGNI